MERQAPSPTTVLNTRLSDLEGCWLELHCCKGMTQYPLRLMAQRYDGSLLLREVLDRLRCERCWGRPTNVALLETILTDGKDWPTGWRVTLKTQQENKHADQDLTP